MNAAGLVLTLLAAQAEAQTNAPLEPLSFTLGVKVGAYQPNLDASPGLDGATPYRDLFGDDTGIFVAPQLRSLWAFGAFDVGFALSVGWVQQTTNALVDNGSDDEPSTSSNTSGGETSIRVIPLSALGVVRLRGLADWTGWPLVPYVEAGPAYAFWKVGRGSQTDESGGSLGWQVVGGLALRLDVLEPLSAKALRDQFQIRGTELTFEWSHLQTDGFGRDETLRVGDSTWTIGLAVGY